MIKEEAPLRKREVLQPRIDGIFAAYLRILTSDLTQEREIILCHADIRHLVH